MGLDIMMYEVIQKDKECGDRESSEFTLYPEETNKSILRLFDKFKHLAFKKREEYLDIEKYKNEHGLKGYTIVEQVWMGEDSTLTFMKYNGKGKLDENSNKTVVKVSDIPTKMQEDLVLKACEVKYQRKGMKKEFYTEVVAGCWYIDDNTKLDQDDSLEFITTQNEFERVKKYVDCEYCDKTFADWDFVEGRHFIFFSY